MDSVIQENKKKKKRKTILIVSLSIVVILILAIIGALFGVANYLVDFAIKRTDNFNTNLDPSNDGSAPDENDLIITENSNKFKEYKEEWLKNVKVEAVEVTSDDNLNLKGNIYYISTSSHNYALLIHGYRSNADSMLNFAAIYNQEMNFNCLVPSLRGCGESDGEYLGMGYLDSYDMLKWLDLIISKDPKANIFISGVSMGGATSMMVSGLDLPSNVKCIIEDCGYTSVWDIFAHELDFLYHLPTFPILDIASALSSWKANYSFKEASSLTSLAKSEVPMLFIHGEEDSFVPFNMLDEVYNAKVNGYKEKLVVKGAGHANSYLREPETYFTTAKNFLSKYFELN